MSSSFDMSSRLQLPVADLKSGFQNSEIFTPAEGEYQNYKS